MREMTNVVLLAPLAAYFCMRYYCDGAYAQGSGEPTKCYCYEASFGGIDLTECPVGSALANATYMMTTDNCTLELAEEQFNISVDIGLTCNSSGLPLQFCELTICSVTSSSVDFPFSYEIYVNKGGNLYGILDLKSNGIAIDTNHEYNLTVTCRELRFRILNKVLRVLFRGGTSILTKSIFKTKSASQIVTFFTTVPTTLKEQSQSFYSTTVHNSTQKLTESETWISEVRKGKETTPAALFTSTGTFLRKTVSSEPVCTSLITEGVSLKTHTQRSLSRTSAFLSNPVNLTAISVVCGLILLAAISAGAYALISQCGNSNRISPSSNGDEDKRMDR